MDWLNVPDVADALGVPVTRVRQMIRDRTFLARRIDGVLKIPALFIDGNTVVKGLPGLLTLLADAGFSDDEALDWMFREDPSLPGTPAAAMAANRGKEVRRRAQALGF